mmetsp:Transcript_78831/g.109525  ORF Transcript_78831/g.109525 Transcript_78831/m.109525 type:complete len:233 (-) Transcript_78831:126-824(-)
MWPLPAGVRNAVDLQMVIGPFSCECLHTNGQSRRDVHGNPALLPAAVLAREAGAMDAAVLVHAAGASHHSPHAPFEVDLGSAPIRIPQSARQNVADPVQASRHPRVHPWVMGITAAETPRGHPGNDKSITMPTNKWATAISLACIHNSSPRCASRTNHGVRHRPVGLRVVHLTTVVRHGGHDGLLEDAGLVTLELQPAPASDLAHAPDTLEVVSRQASRSDAARLWYRSIQL